ncbi:MAG: right-handed parallel beta-helix repeat-containing protein [Myxococcales bacterium]|nr:right-handed parallel beta-helix repeat-containing protein [Myxococcales bacterium]
MTVTLIAVWAGCVGPWPEDVVPSTIDSDFTLTSNRIWRLQEPVFVVGDAVLTIEPGTRVVGTQGSALIVTRNATLEARGTVDEPILFTSDQPSGERAPGDWGGLVLLGSAPTNEDDPQLEGLDETDVRGIFGGDDPEDSCGALTYARIEYAGFFLNRDSDLNGLTLGGCGSGTIIDYVQTHRTLDDGVEVVGGTVGLRHVLITYPEGDGLDWEGGWRGRAQFLIVQTNGDSTTAIAGENEEDEPDATPRSNPTLFNVTLLGDADPQGASRGLVLADGSAATFRNSIIGGFPGEALDIRGRDSATLANNDITRMTNTIVFESGPNGDTFFLDEKGDDDDDNGLIERDWFEQPDADNLLSADRLMPDGLAIVDLEVAPDEPEEPVFTLNLDAVPADLPTAPVEQDRFWDESANFHGAVRPDTPPGEAWWQGWTRFDPR